VSWPYHLHATVRLHDDGDPRAVGAAVTTALCGHWEHEPPCRWSHHTATTPVGDEVRVTVGFDCAPADESEVRARIHGALASGRLEGGPTGATSWEVVAEQPPLDGPHLKASDPRELLLGYLDWYREALMRKIDGLTDVQLRAPVSPMGWSPLGLVQHLGWVERRWLQWGLAAADVVPYPPAGDAGEWGVHPGRSSAEVLATYAAEVARSRELVAGVPLGQQARTGGRFVTADHAPTLVRILFHLLQEYARHLGHLDIARELIDGTTGE